MSETLPALPRETIWLVSPVFRDCESYLRLRQDARAVLAAHDADVDLRFVAVDDTAGDDPAVAALQALPDQTVMTPPFPLGHQRAIVFGLRQLATIVDEEDRVVTLDADGEDKPEDLPHLLAPLAGTGASLRTVVVAMRTRRHESPPFKILYFLFKIFFRSLTGTIIRSGNYAAYRGWLVRNVLFHPAFDLCYSSSLLSLGLAVTRVPCERGKRYAGASKMTYLKLIQHGLRMLMPFADRIAIRGLVVLTVLFAASLAGTAALLGGTMAGLLSSPGWLIYVLCTATLLCALAVACMVIVFALFVQAQSLSLAQLDTGLRAPEGAARASSARRRA